MVVSRAPDGRFCKASRASGTVAAQDVSSVAVDCSAEVNWVTNEPVNTTALSEDGRLLYIGGAFTRVGRRTGSFVAADAASGVVRPYAIVNGAVNAQVSDGAGG